MKSPGTGRRWLLAQARRDQPGPLCPLSNWGLLFLDELPEFGNRMLEMLGQPLDPTGKVVSISHSAGSLTYPASFTLIASMNPCPCGSDPEKECTC